MRSRLDQTAVSDLVAYSRLYNVLWFSRVGAHQKIAASNSHYLLRVMAPRLVHFDMVSSNPDEHSGRRVVYGGRSEEKNDVTQVHYLLRKKKKKEASTGRFNHLYG